MGFLAAKRILVAGLLSNRSIAHGIARAMHRERTEFTYTHQNERFQESVAKMAADFGSSRIFACDVQNHPQVNALVEQLGEHWDGLDGRVNSIVFAPGKALRFAQKVSAFSFRALAKAARPPNVQSGV